MQQSFKKGFEKDSMLMGSAIAGSILWIINAVFNYIATDYRAFLINILYVIRDRCIYPADYSGCKDRR